MQKGKNDSLVTEDIIGVKVSDIVPALTSTVWLNHTIENVHW